MSDTIDEKERPIDPRALFGKRPKKSIILPLEVYNKLKRHQDKLTEELGFRPPFYSVISILLREKERYDKLLSKIT